MDKMMRDRKHLTELEVQKLMAAVKGSRNEARDRCLLILMFRHGLRVSEACGWRMSQVDVESRVLHVIRLKKGPVHDPSPTNGRGQGHQGVAGSTGEDEAGDGGLLCERATQPLEPQDGVAGDQDLRGGGRTSPSNPYP